nr:hypothetical protein [uncultured Sphingomonas sp.]
MAVSGPSHPFRRALADARKASKDASSEEDLKLFVLSFTAFFVCFYTFLL